MRLLKMSEGAAYRRINAARLTRRFPCLLARIASGEIHVSGLVILRDHLTDANAEELSAAACGLSESKLRALVATRAPRPPVADTILAMLPPPEQATLEVRPSGPALGREKARVEPLSPTSFLVQFTMSAATHAKMQRARDIACIVDRALDFLVADAERGRRAPTKRPRRGAAPGEPSAAITRAARRATFVRDGEQCTYESEAGERCASRSFLELDHAVARARGGCSEPSNLRVFCRAHNRLHAEQDFGRAHVERQIQKRRRQRLGNDAAATSAAPNIGAPDHPDEHFRQRKSSGVAAPPLPDGSASSTAAPPLTIFANTLVLPAPPRAAGGSASSTAAPPLTIFANTSVLPAPPRAAGGNTSVLPAPPRAAGGNTSVLPAPPRAAGGNTSVLPAPPRAAGGNTPVLPAPPRAAGGNTSEGASTFAEGGGFGDEARAIHGLVDLGFRRPACVHAVRSILARRGGRVALADVLREAIGVLAALDKGELGALSVQA